MSKLQKKISISLLVISMLLVSTIGALADGPFSLVGELDISGTAPNPIVYKVGAQVFIFDPLAVCTDAAGVTMLCTALTDGLLVEVKGNSSGTVFTATEVAVLSKFEGEVSVKSPLTLTRGVTTKVFNTTGATLPEFYAVGDTLEVTYKVVGTVNVALEVKFVASGANSVYEYEGPIVSTSETAWVVGTHTFIVDGDTNLPDFYAKDDTVLVSFKMTTGGYLALDITFIASFPGNTYPYSGPLMGWDGTTWTVGDYPFDMSEVDLPIYFNTGDMVDLIFRIEPGVVEGWVYIVEEYTLTTTVDPKVDSNRCANVREHPGVRKISEEEGYSYEEVWDLFCKGFGLGEIKLAIRYSKDSDYTPQMLLDLRAMGYSWGDLKKMAKGNIAPEGYSNGEDDGGETAMPGNGKNKEKDTPPGLVNKPDKHNVPSIENETAAPDGPGNSENAPGHNKDNNGKGKNK
jgi:hypothetical protein